MIDKIENYMKIIIPFGYSSMSLAPFNRLCGYYRGLKELGANVVFLVFYREGVNIPFDVPEGIEFIILSLKASKIINRVNKFRQTIKTINSHLESGDCLFLCGVPFEIFSYYSRRKDITIVGEITEKQDSQAGKHNFLQSILYYLTDKKIKEIDGLFVISKSLRDYYISKNIPSEKIEIINMFVDCNRMNNVKTIATDKCVTFCGTVSPEKDGVDILIRAFSIFHEKHLDFKLKLVGPFLCRNDEIYLKNLINSLALDNSVEFTGMVSTCEIPSIIKNASILALARPESIQSFYGFPTKLGEYLSTSVPIVVTNIGEISYFLKDMVNCRIAEPSNVEDFAEKLCWVADNYDKATEMAKKGHELVLSDFSYKVQSEKLYNKILEIMNKK